MSITDKKTNFWQELKTLPNPPFRKGRGIATRLTSLIPLFTKGGIATGLTSLVHLFAEKRGKYPILALAPMAGITDSAFRQICKKYGADVVYTEMISADGLYYDAKKTLAMLEFVKSEQPVVIQLFGKDATKFTKAAQLVEAAGFSGIDINFGCPAKKVAGRGGGVTLMRDLDKCRQIIEATLAGTKLPVSVKLRSSIKPPLTPPFVKGENTPPMAPSFTKGENTPPMAPSFVKGEDTPTLTPICEKKGGEGFKSITALDFLQAMDGLPLSAVMIHGRPYENPFAAEIDYEMIKECVDYLKEKSPSTVVLGNGGINLPEEAKKMLELTGVDGLGLARGLYGRPWLFEQIKKYLKTGQVPDYDKKKIKKVILEHAQFALKTKEQHGLIELRKHLLWYVKGWPNAKELRAELVRVESLKQIKEILKTA